MSIYSIAKEGIDKSAYTSEQSLQRAILNYINNCLSNFGGNLEVFKKLTDENDEYIINSTLESILKNYVLNNKRFPFVNHFEAWRTHPELYQNKVDETILVVKSFLDHNFTEEVFQKQRQKIKDNMYEVLQIIEEANRNNYTYECNMNMSIKNFIPLITLNNQKLEEYFSMVYYAYKELEYNDIPSFTVNEKILLEYIKSANTLQTMLEVLKSEHMLAKYTNKYF